MSGEVLPLGLIALAHRYRNRSRSATVHVAKGRSRGNIFSLINVGERSGMGLSDLFAHWQEAGYAQPTITETYDSDQVTVIVQVELARSKSAVKNAVKCTSPQLRTKVVDKCAELYTWLNEDRSRTTQQAIAELGYSDRSLTNYLEILRDAGTLEHDGPRNGGEWVFMI